MIILTLDFGAKMGYAVGDERGKLVAHGCKNFKSKSIQESFAKYSEWINAEIRQRKVDAVGYELVMAHLGTHAAHVYGGYWALTLAACHQHGLHDIRSEHVATIKKHATGNGRAEKEDVIKAVCNKYDLPFIADDNAADAVALYDLIKDRINSGHKTMQDAVPERANERPARLELPKVQRNRKAMAGPGLRSNESGGKRRRKHTSDA